MLHFFYSDKNYPSSSQYFENTDIGNNADAMKLNGSFHVIHLNFSDIATQNLEILGDKVSKLMIDVYDSFSNFLCNDHLFNKYNTEFIYSTTGVQFSLGALIDSLYRVTGKKTVLLIDEFDKPWLIALAKTTPNIDELVEFMNTFLSCIKENGYLYRIILVVINPIPSLCASHFMNNVYLNSIMDKKFSTVFGFIEEEVKSVFSKLGLESHLPLIKEWYDGYANYDGISLFNPFDIEEFILHDRICQSYWIRSGEMDQVITSVLKKCSQPILQNLATIRYSSMYIDLARYRLHTFFSAESIYAHLYYSGYIQPIANSRRKTFTNEEYAFTIPNKEIAQRFDEIFQELIKTTENIQLGSSALEYLITGQFEAFEKKIKDLLLTFSYFDLKKTPENLYHVLIGTILMSSCTSQAYALESNIESGDGRPDIVIMPKSSNGQGAIIEIKLAKNENSLNSTSEEAMSQIEAKRYYTRHLQNQIQSVYYVAISFYKKKMSILKKQMLLQGENYLEKRIQIQEPISTAMIQKKKKTRQFNNFFAISRF